MKGYALNVAGLERRLPFFPIDDGMYIAGFVMMGDVELTVRSARELLKICPEYDFIVTPETKSIPLAMEMARQRGDASYIVARKQAKVYMRDSLHVGLKSITTQSEQSLYLDGKDADMLKNRRALLVDDVISTGGSLAALERLVQMAGGNVVGRAAVLAEGEAADREDIIFLAPLPLFTAADVEI
ncbi:MAG: adenine phosphoribosyltransferase [Oscillospiraceae bacterium]|nr:adenine phosphoribosyltransferase [Oscillospiraceae bacterium]